jgi:threonine/homoserine/homoserine lactone efflux protein
VAFNIIKILGAVYLFYLGIKAFRSKRTQTLFLNKDEDHANTSFDSFRKGFFVGLLNPKSVIFFMAFLPQFVRDGLGTFWGQIINLGAITILMGIVFEIAAIFMTNEISKTLFRKKIFSSLVDKLTGSILILLGLRLAFTTQNK